MGYIPCNFVPLVDLATREEVFSFCWNIYVLIIIDIAEIFRNQRLVRMLN